ncbi:MAG: HigA family addiction module antidote protein [Proteobacteria bacterium]|nr:HigA family addiction module antidote protein [Pseudomonadota bacterium]
MRMKNPSHPGRLVKADLEALGLSISKAAKGLGVTRQQLYKVVNCESAISPEMAVRLAMGIGSTPDMWLRLQAKYDLAQLRKRGNKTKIKVRRFEDCVLQDQA